MMTFLIAAQKYLYIKNTYVAKKIDHVPTWLLPIRQWPHGSSCARAHELT